MLQGNDDACMNCQSSGTLSVCRLPEAKELLVMHTLAFFNSLLTSLHQLTVCSTEATQNTKAEIEEATLNEEMLD